MSDSIITARELALLDAIAGEDFSLCPYNIKQVTGLELPGDYGPGTCTAGCVDEPRCVTCGPNALDPFPDLLAAYAERVIAGIE